MPEHAETGRTDSRDQILAAAATLFRDQGYHGTSLKMIAKSAGVTAPALYWHFQSKADLLYEFLLATSRDSLAQIEACTDGMETPEDLLAGVVTGHLRVQLDRLDATRAFGALTFSSEQLIKSLGEAKAEDISQYQRQHVRQCRDVIQWGVEQQVFEVPDPLVSSFAILNMCESVGGWYRKGRTLGDERLIELHVQLALRMVGLDEERIRTVLAART